jgi:hypothetical protein
MRVRLDPEFFPNVGGTTRSYAAMLVRGTQA